MQGGKQLAIIKGYTTFATATAHRRVDAFHPRKRFTMFTLTHDGSATPSLRVLVIDDDADNAASLAMLLHISGYEAEAACCGAAAERAVRSRPPDALFIDIGLPKEDGYAVAKELRSDPATAGAKLIAITGYGTDADQQLARAAGFEHVLTKPADPEALQELLARVAAEGLDTERR